MNADGRQIDPSLASTVGDQRVVRTVFVNYALASAGNFASSVWNWWAGQAAVDPASGDLWIPTVPITRSGVAAPSYGPTLVYNPSSNQTSVFANLTNASALAFDESNGLLFASEPLANDVIAINMTTGQPAGPPIQVGVRPVALALDKTSQQLFVANSGSDNVTVISAAGLDIVRSGIPVGLDPTTIASDSTDGLLFVANSGGSNLTVLNMSGDDPAPVSSIPLSYAPSSLSWAAGPDLLAVGMPSAPYLQVLDAESGGTSGLFSVGTGVTAIATNQSGSEFVIANNSGENLTVVNSTSHTDEIVSQDLNVGVTPLRIWDALNQSDLFVWSNRSRVIGTIDLESSLLVQTAPDLGVRAGDAAYDSDSDRVLLTDRTSNAVDFLNATSLQPSRAPLLLPGAPDSIVDDPLTGVVFVGYVGGVEGISPETGAVLLENDSLPGNNSDLVADSTAGFLWDLNSVSGLLSLNLSSLNGSLLTGLDVGQVNIRGVALDSLNNNLYVVDRTNSSIAILNASSGIPDNPPITGIPGLTSVAYDSADGLLYALGAAVYAINTSTDDIVAGPISIGSHTAAWSIVYDASQASLEISTSDASPAYNGTLVILGGASLNASLGGMISVPVGQLPLVAVPVDLPGSMASDSGEIWVPNDASGTLSVIASPPEVTYFFATPNPVDQNVATRFLLSYVGGAGPSVVSYSGLPSSCVSVDALDLNCTPAARGTYNVTVDIVDSLGYVASAIAVLSVSPTIHVRLSLSATQLDLGMPLNATASIPSGSGTAPYSFAWTWGDGKSSKGAAQTHTYGTTGTYVLTVTATDGGGGVASTAATVTVVAAPQVGLSSSSPVNETDVDIPIQLNATVVGGTTPGTGTWNLTGGVVLHGLSVSHKFKTVGIYFANFTYVDASGYTVTKTMSVQVNPALSIKLSALPSTAPIVVGSSILFNVTISGGTAPYSVFWSFDDGSYASGISTEHSFASPGTYNVSLSVEDAAGVWQNSSDKVTVDANSTGHGLLGGSVIAGVFVGAVVGLALGTLILFLVGRRRRKTPPGAPQPYTTGGSTPPTTEGPSAPPESGAPTEWRED